jgi:hypothetical protein
LLAEAGLVRVCARPGELAELAGELARDRRGLLELESSALRYAEAHDIADGLPTLTGQLNGNESALLDDDVVA